MGLLVSRQLFLSNNTIQRFVYVVLIPPQPSNPSLYKIAGEINTPGAK
jgi:hypothetical protein